MTISQLFFAMAALFLTSFGLFAGYVKNYIDAKIDPVAKQVDHLVEFMVNYAQRISALETKTSKL